ncbi:MAG: hypothetical protein WBQ29_17390, partial [Isosphaeraceae bacterium]
MSRPLTIRKPTADELHQLHHWLEQPLQSGLRRRAEVLVPPEQRCVAKTSLYSCACAEPAESPWLTIRSAGWG